MRNVSTASIKGFAVSKVQQLGLLFLSCNKNSSADKCRCQPSSSRVSVSEVLSLCEIAARRLGTHPHFRKKGGRQRNHVCPFIRKAHSPSSPPRLPTAAFCPQLQGRSWKRALGPASRDGRGRRLGINGGLPSARSARARTLSERTVVVCPGPTDSPQQARGALRSLDPVSGFPGAGTQSVH